MEASRSRAELPSYGEDGRPNSSSSGYPQEEKINIYLKVIKTVPFEVRKSETIQNLKALLHEKEGISGNLHELFFAGDQLKNGRRLVDYGIQKDSTLHVFVQNLVGKKIHVKTLSNQEIIEFEASSYDTIRSIKSMIQLKEGIRPELYTLVYNGMVLEDDRTVASVGSESTESTTFHMVFNSKEILSIFVEAPTGEIVKLKVKASFTVRDVKAIVACMVGLHVTDRTLMYAGKQLEDCEKLAWYDIKEESVLEMLPLNI